MPRVRELDVTDARSLPGPFEHAWDWQLDAACRGADSRLFFPPSGRPDSAQREREAEAKRMCAACPVQLACRRYALEARESYGVWGGMTEDERLIRSGRRPRRRRTG